MKRFLFSAACLLFLTAPCTAPARDYAELNAMMGQALGDEAKMCAFIEKVSRELKIHPEDRGLRSLRITAYSSMGDFFSAKPDVEVLAASEPDSPSARFMLCMYEEATGADKESYLACYARTAEMFEEKGMSKNDSLNYLYALLLAESPKAEAVKERYLSTLSDSPWDQDMRSILENFSRDMLVTRLEPAQVRKPCVQKR